MGESLKQIDKITEGKFLVKYPQKHLPLMLKVIQKMINNLEIENK